MKHNHFKWIMFLPILITVVIFTSSCFDSNRYNIITPNTDIISYKDFFVTTENSGADINTSVRGTIFIRGDKNNSSDRHAQIISWVAIDRLDPGRGFYSIFIEDGKLLVLFRAILKML